MHVNTRVTMAYADAAEYAQIAANGRNSRTAAFYGTVLCADPTSPKGT